MCNFCQNYDISHLGHGEKISNEQLAGIMLHLQNGGCHNINFVTPSHVVPQILSAVEIAIQNGLSVPLVYNTGGYDSLETLKLLEGVFDIYMPDFKFWDPEVAQTTCNAEDYPEVAQKALIEMHRQVGDLITDDAGIARRGILLRHLVLPHGLAGTREIMRFIARKISLNTYVNIMPQYRPCGRAGEVEGLSVHLSQKDYKKAFENLAVAGGFDSFGNIHRAQYYQLDEKGVTFIERAIRYGNKFQENKNSAQVSLFGEASEVQFPEPEIPEAEKWGMMEELSKEKELVSKKHLIH